MSNKGEQVRQKSPAEFFSENQIIAGFDNPGKSLYTSIRELVENSLDAAEAIGVLPDIELEVLEYTEAQFNKQRGLCGRAGGRLDADLFRNPGEAKKILKGGKGKANPAAAADDDDDDDAVSGDGKRGRGGSAGKVMYYKVTCKDNGCGLPHKDIPNMLGRVLSGSKYGVRQTRGKFGLGAKMALIWSKKSTGMPIEVRSAHSTDPSVVPTFVTTCVLDIDIHRNEPKVEVHEKAPNTEGWRGAAISVTVGGSWTTYRGKVLSYFQQLAVITPYASFKLKFAAAEDLGGGASGAEKRSLEVHYVRRSTTIPESPTEVKFHPSSVDNLLVSQLLQASKAQDLASFLVRDLQGVDKSVASRVVAELGAWASDMTPDGVAQSAQRVMALTQALRDVALFKPPDGRCLSPAGEYNLRLGIQKEVDPTFVATYTMPKASAHDGHAFIVEAGVCIGGTNAREGITVHRFANRIPLLFEAGSDVATRVANKRIKWASYKIDAKKDKVGVFVSIVSTKIPFKGTSKEYIGEDIEPMAEAVRKALMQCAAQLKHHIARREAEKDARNRRKNLTKYVPDVSDALFKVLSSVYERDGGAEPAPSSSSSSSSALSSPNSKKRALSSEGLGTVWWPAKRSLMAKMHAGALSKGALAAALTAQADSVDEATCAAQEAAEQDYGDHGASRGGGGGGGNGDAAGNKKNGKKNGSSGGGDSSSNGWRNCYLVALPEDTDDAEDEEEEEEGDGVATWAPAASSSASVLLPVLHHPAFSLKLLRNCFFFNPAPAKAITSKS